MDPTRPTAAPPQATASNIEPDYDSLPHDDFNPMWEIAIAMGILLLVFAAIVAFS